MDIRYAADPESVKSLDTETLRKTFLISEIFVPDAVKMTYSHIDRIIVGGVCPQTQSVPLETGKETGTKYFLERRELGIINVGGPGRINIDQEEFTLESRDGIYVGQGNQQVEFSSLDQDRPAKFYFNSAPAHTHYPTVKISINQARPVSLGSQSESNQRTIYQYLHPEVLQSCQLVMGLTMLEPNNMWNTMPCHTHERRMEVYFYFDLQEDANVFHFMGQPEETRHLVVRNEQAVLSPSWSIHTGVGTKHYTFIWGMVGENQTFTDMDMVPMSLLK
ncbi:MAG: 5-dehydro-4-deoxy-D-glucuronate isomerase [SAR324 cluster bacterium]|nr:5-dehydro-4-deoxy-D-glucuronate isomerase [SAR324 cluster bacterium]